MFLCVCMSFSRIMKVSFAGEGVRWSQIGFRIQNLECDMTFCCLFIDKKTFFKIMSLYAITNDSSI